MKDVANPVHLHLFYSVQEGALLRISNFSHSADLGGSHGRG